MTAVCISCILFIRRKCRPFFGPDAFHPPTKEVYHETSETLAGSDGCSGVGPQPADWLLYEGGISSNLLLEVLMGQVENVSVETEPAFDRALKAAVQRGGSDPDAVLNALVEELEITAPLRFSISGLGSGSAGQQGLDVVFQSGTNPNAAANNAATAWLPILRGLEGNGGAYSARASLVEVNGGYILAIGVKVEQPGEEDEPDPVTLTGISVSGCKTEYFVGQSFDPTGMTVTATYSNNTTKTISDITTADKKGVSWTPDGALAEGSHEITITYGGKTATVKVTVKESTVKSIEVSGYTRTYTEGELFTYSGNGMTVTVNYTYGAPKTITGIKNYGDQGVTWEPADALTTEIKNVKVTYTDPNSEKGSAFFEVPVTVNTKPATVTGIEVTSNPTKMTYISGESFNPAGMTVSEVYSDGTKTAVTDYTYSTAPLTKDTTEVTISYGGKSTTVKVKILEGDDSYDAKTKTYSIATADGLLARNETVQSNLSLNCTLTKDINMMDKEWTPIGNSFQTYNGTFDGQGHSITGLNASSLFGGIGESATVKNLQLVGVELNESGGATAGIVVNNYGTIMACPMTGEISAYSYTSGIANFNLGTIVACWFSGTLKENEGYGIVAFNYGTITACFWDGNTTNGYRSNEGGTVEATKVEGTITWQTAVDGMNAALTGNDYQWALGTDDLPVLQKK